MLRQYCGVNHIEPICESSSLNEGSSPSVDSLKTGRKSYSYKKFLISGIIFFGLVYIFISFSGRVSDYISQQLQDAPMAKGSYEPVIQSTSPVVIVRNSKEDDDAAMSDKDHLALIVERESSVTARENDLAKKEAIFDAKMKGLINQEEESNKKEAKIKLEIDAIQKKESDLKSRENEVAKKEVQLSWILTGEKKLVKDVFKGDSDKKTTDLDANK